MHITECGRPEGKIAAGFWDSEENTSYPLKDSLLFIIKWILQGVFFSIFLYKNRQNLNIPSNSHNGGGT